MRSDLSLAALAAVVCGCSGGDWVVTTWGEDYIESGIPEAEFVDGCSATFDRFSVGVVEAALLDGDGEPVDSLVGGTVELTEPGPQELGRLEVPATLYDTARFEVGAVDGAAVSVAGTVVCPSGSVSFDWSFDASTVYSCEPSGLTVPAKGEATTELTIHGDHLFYDGLEDPDAQLQAEAWVAADADGDGVLTETELEAVSVAALGYSVGRYSEVTDLRAFVAHLTQTLGHVDGEGHCDVDL